eukprot:6197050-Pleurochrysis_carterae.AAC.1
MESRSQVLFVGAGLDLQSIIRLKLAGATTTVVREASYFRITQLHRDERGREPSASRCCYALRDDLNSRTRRNRAMTHQYQCQNMQVRMNDNQSRNLPSQSYPRGRGNLASIARQRKLSNLPTRPQ